MENTRAGNQATDAVKEKCESYQSLGKNEKMNEPKEIVCQWCRE
jgi:hypothetical protein